MIQVIWILCIENVSQVKWIICLVQVIVMYKYGLVNHEILIAELHNTQEYIIMF